MIIRRIRGSRLGAVVASITITLPLPLVFTVASAAYSPGFGQILFYVPFMLFTGRASMMGIELRGDEMIVHSWYRNYRIARHAIHGVDLLPYSGLINRSAESGIDPLWQFCRMLVVRHAGRELRLPATISSRKTAERNAAIIRKWAGLPERVKREEPNHRR